MRVSRYLNKRNIRITDMSISISNDGLVESDVKLVGKTAVITGCNTGIGYETALDFAHKGAKVILACRNIEKANDARERIISSSKCDPNLILVKIVDLASFNSVRNFANVINEEEHSLDILVNNAGVMMCPHTITEDGFELQLQVNHLSHFLLTNLLLNLLKKSAPSRIITVSSFLHQQASPINWAELNTSSNYNARNSYYQSKLLNILFSRQLSKKLENTGVTANSVHPGIVQTELAQHIKRGSENLLWKCLLCISYLPVVDKMIWINAKHGAQTTIFCAIAPELENISGKYFSNFRIVEESRQARSDMAAEKLWKISEEMTAISN